MKNLLQTTAVALAAITAASAVAAQDVPADHAKTARETTPCFYITQWRGWKAPNDHTIYLGVNFRDVYEVQITGSSPLLQDTTSRIVSVTRGPETVCNPVDLQLTISQTPYGVQEPLIVRSLVKLTPEQVKAIPKKYLPY
ncbi:MAG: hypothetical protein JO111_03830 [Caulobacteraceae bacterium]|nr:hypothetical protein [Caulobacteraceae bacterium]